MTIILFLVLARYRLPVIPFLIIFAAQAIIYLGERIKNKEYQRLRAALLGLILLGIIINCSTLRRRLYPIFHPQGTYLTTDKSLLIRDDSGDPVNVYYAILLDSPLDQVRKQLIIPRDIPAINWANLIIDGVFVKGAELLISVNGNLLDASRLPAQVDKFPLQSRITLPVKPIFLVKGVNEIRIRVKEGTEFEVLMDYYYDYNRSGFCARGEEWRQGRIGPNLADGEYKINLVLGTSP